MMSSLTIIPGKSTFRISARLQLARRNAVIVTLYPPGTKRGAAKRPTGRSTGDHPNNNHDNHDNHVDRVTPHSKLNNEVPPPPTVTAISAELLQAIQDRNRLIGCNIYITAGGDRPHHAPILTALIQRAQTLFREKSSKYHLPSSSDDTEGSQMDTTFTYRERYDLGVLTHAYTDQVYNRTSLHLAGTPEIILDVASDVIQHAVVELRKLVVHNDASNKKEGDEEGEDDSTNIRPNTAHPNVGWIDHIAVVPLVTGVEAQVVDATIFTPHFIQTHGANVARKLGRFMRENCDIKIFYYGLAHRTNVSLVKIRKRRTSFFQSDGYREELISMDPESTYMDSCTIGAPEEFVENYNLRVKATCPKKVAQQLSRFIRESSGGFAWIEALCLPYSKDRWEIACNVLRPYAGGTSVNDLKEYFRSWNKGKSFIEKGYRVGTTAEQNIKVLETISRSAQNRQAHDEKVMTTFQKNLQTEE